MPIQATWGDYQTLFQLATGANFTYASLELFVAQPLSVLAHRRDEFLEEVKALAQTGDPRGKTDPGQFDQIQSKLEFVEGAQSFFNRLNPYVATSSAIIGFGLLIWISSNSHEPAHQLTAGVLLGICFGWFWVALLLLTVCRLLLEIGVEPHLPSVKK
jgi:hypothetical protein